MKGREQKLTLRQMGAILCRAFSVSLRTKSAVTIAINLLGFGLAFLPVLAARKLQVFTDALQGYLTSDMLPLNTVIFLFLQVIALFLAQELYAFLSQYALGADAIRTQRYIKRKIVQCQCRVQYRYIENDDGFQQKISFAESYAGERTAQSMQSLINILQNLVMFCVVTLELGRVNPWVVVAVLATSFPAAILVYQESDDTYHTRFKWMLEGESVIKQFIAMTRPEAMKDIRHSRSYPYFKRRWRKTADGYIAKKDKLARRYLLFNSAADILRNIVFIFVLLLVCGQVYREPSLGVGVVMLVLSLSQRLQKTATALFAGASAFGSDIYYMKDFFDIDHFAREETDAAEPALTGADICAENVTFTYPNSVSPALNELTLHIKDGEKIAIVGENGSGKTTFVNLLCGLYQPAQGKMSVGGQPVEKALRSVRELLSVVFQDFCHYEATLRENITVSDKARTPTAEEMNALLHDANIEDLVAQQPHGLDEEIGLFSQTGNNLSGGQWQRVAIARALYRNKARILVLDEPTAALDPMAEADLYANFTKMAGNKTVILISHRLGITKLVDRILVFHNGRIIEDGSHEELMAKGGHYRQLYTSQAKWYQ